MARHWVAAGGQGEFSLGLAVGFVVGVVVTIVVALVIATH